MTLTPEDDMMTDGAFRYHAVTGDHAGRYGCADLGRRRWTEAAASDAGTAEAIEDFGRIWL